MSVMRRGRTAVMMMSVLCAGCGTDAMPGADMTVRDSAGVRIVESRMLRPDAGRLSFAGAPVIDVGRRGRADVPSHDECSRAGRWPIPGG